MLKCGVARKPSQAQPRSTTLACACVILSQSRQENFARIVWMSFHERGSTSSVFATLRQPLAGGCPMPSVNKVQERSHLSAVDERNASSRIVCAFGG